jgi:hypothetical protein
MFEVIARFLRRLGRIFYCDHEGFRIEVTPGVSWCINCGALKEYNAGWLLPDQAVGKGVRPAYGDGK